MSAPYRSMSAEIRDRLKTQGYSAKRISDMLDIYRQVDRVAQEIRAEKERGQ